MNSMSKLFLVLLMMLSVGACASSESSGSQGQKDPNQITTEDIEQSKSMGNVYSLVQRLRPQWLRKRGRSSISSPGDIIVYVGGARFGGPGSLRQVEVTNVEALEFLSAAQATNRFGGGHEHGAIIVQMKSR